MGSAFLVLAAILTTTNTALAVTVAAAVCAWEGFLFYRSGLDT